jgi:hypothetical protein
VEGVFYDILRGISAGNGRLSDSIPKTTCIADELTVDASTCVPAEAKERSPSAIRNGSSAGRTPRCRSVSRCSADSAPIACPRPCPALSWTVSCAALVVVDYFVDHEPGFYRFLGICT